MRLTKDAEHHRTRSIRGAFAYGSVVASAFASFLVPQRYFGAPVMVPVVFGLGATYAVLGILSGAYGDGGHRCRTWRYYAVQLVLVTAIICLSPSRGLMAIVALPVLSQAIFDYAGTTAIAIGVYLFVLCVGIWRFPSGWGAVQEAAMSYSTAFVFTVAFTLMTKQALDARDRQTKLREEIEAANEQLRRQAQQADELATTRERNRVAREIHDGVGHYLTVIKTQLDAAAALTRTDLEKAQEILTKAAMLTGEALDDVRHSVGALRTDAPRPPLPEALRRLGEQAGLPLRFEVCGDPRPLAPGLEHALFRAVQEGLTNVRKHAAASAVEITLDFRRPDRVTVGVVDNGKGHDGGNPAGFGLVGIRERIEVLGGRVDCANRTHGGFALTVEVPA